MMTREQMRLMVACQALLRELEHIRTDTALLESLPDGSHEAWITVPLDSDGNESRVAH